MRLGSLSLMAAVFLVGASGVAASDAQGRGVLSIHVDLPENKIVTTDVLALTIQARAPAGWRVAFPSIGAELGDWTVLDSRIENPTMIGEDVSYSLRLRLSPFLAGEYDIPSLRVEAISLLDPDLEPVVQDTVVERVLVQSVFQDGLIRKQFHGVVAELGEGDEASWRREIGLALGILFIVSSSLVLGQGRQESGQSEQRQASDLALQALFKLRNVSVESGGEGLVGEANGIIHRFFESYYELASVPRVSLGTVGALVACLPEERQQDDVHIRTFFERYDLLRFAPAAEGVEVMDGIYDAFDDLLTSLEAQPAWTEDS